MAWGEQQGIAAEKGNGIWYSWIKLGFAKLTPGSGAYECGLRSLVTRVQTPVCPSVTL